MSMNNKIYHLQCDILPRLLVSSCLLCKSAHRGIIMTMEGETLEGGRKKMTERQIIVLHRWLRGWGERRGQTDGQHQKVEECVRKRNMQIVLKRAQSRREDASWVCDRHGWRTGKEWETSPERLHGEPAAPSQHSSSLPVCFAMVTRQAPDAAS